MNRRRRQRGNIHVVLCTRVELVQLLSLCGLVQDPIKGGKRVGGGGEE